MSESNESNVVESKDDSGTRALGVVAVLGALCLISTAAVAGILGVPFSLWLGETDILLMAAAGYFVILALVWDFGLIIGYALVVALADAGHRLQRSFPRWPERGFFSVGAWPLPLILLTAYVIVGTSNITLISLELLHGVTAWRDPLLWELEGSLLARIAALPIAVTAWDVLYHGAWLIELTALFALIVLARKPRLVLHFCVSFVLLFYVGRFLGLLNPVKGPAFFQPELYLYLTDSVSAAAMAKIAGVMSADPAQVVPSASLLGGVSAMPSLHVGMVALTAYWLAAGRRASLWFGVPWLLAVWSSTVVLGWHYVVDGAGGLVLAAACIAATRSGLARLQADPSATRIPDPLAPVPPEESRSGEPEPVPTT